MDSVRREGLIDSYDVALEFLKRREKLFVVAMETSKTIKAAAIAAGFEEQHASRAGNRYKNIPRVREALDAQILLREAGALGPIGTAQAAETAASIMKEAASLTPDEVIAKLLALGEAAKERKQYSAAIKAIELAGKHIGMWSTKIEVDIKTTYAQLVEASVGVIDMGEAETADGEESDTPPAPSEDGLPESGGPLES